MSDDTSELRFDGRVALVTGAGGGLGREYAMLLARRGAHVVVNDVGGDVSGAGAGGAAEQVVKEIRSAGGSAVADTGSVADADAAGQMVAVAVDTFGRLDIVINNAGILRDKAFHHMTTAEIDPVIDVHLRGTFYVTSAAWPHLREARYGRVVNTSSNSGLIGNFGQSNYGAAKMGVVGATRVWAIEGERYDIHVNAIAPAATTRMTEHILTPEVAAALDPSRVAPAVAWLAHEACSTTGEVISAGAGRFARYFIGLTPGWFSKEPTPEELAAHWDEALAVEGFIIPRSPNEELALIMSQWS